jgi:nucleotide-binding universal stress UspA family protein
MAGSIVCCVDDSREARAAVRVARDLGQRLALDLVLLHVAPPVTEPGVSTAPGGAERLAEAEREDADALLQTIMREAGLPPDVELRVEIGDPARGVLAVCEQEQPELVVLGSHGRGGIQATLLGSVSTHVAAKAPCIVVIVPPGAAEKSPPT